MKKFSLALFAILFYAVAANAQWIQVGEDIDGESIQDRSGSSIDFSSDGLTLAIGALKNSGSATDAGHVRVYRNISGAWTQIGSDIDGESEGDNSGTSVSMSSDGTRVAIASPHHDGINGSFSGQVRVYEESNGDWVQIGLDIEGEAAFDESGTEVSLSDDGTILAIGAEGNDGDENTSGQVRVYHESLGGWSQMGLDIGVVSENHVSGASVSLSGNGQIVAVGVKGGSEVGMVQVYEFEDGGWTQVGENIPGLSVGDLTGVSVSISSDGSMVAMGSPLAAGISVQSGVVRVFENIDGEWTQVGSDISGEQGNERVGGFGGVRLSEDGSTVIAAAKTFGNSRGKVRVFRNISGEWEQMGENILGEAQNDQCGYSVSISGDGNIVAAGAIFNAGSAPNAGHVRVFQMGSTGVSEAHLSEASVFPNPTKGNVRIDLNQNVQSLTMHMYNAQGAELYSTKLGSLSSFNHSLPETSGLYFIQLVTEKGEARTLKVVRSE